MQLILRRRSGNINHTKDNLRLFLKTKEVIHIFSLQLIFCSQAQSLQVFLWLSQVPSAQCFYPHYLLFAFTPYDGFFLSVLLHTPVPNSLLPLSLPLQLGHICSQIHFTIFPQALPCSQHCWNAYTRKAAATGISPHLWLDSEPLQAARNPHLQLQSKLYYHCFFSFKLLNDTNKQVKLHQYYQIQQQLWISSFLAHWVWFKIRK